MSLVIELEQRGTVGMLLLQMNIVNLRLLGCVSTILANIDINHKIRHWKIIIEVEEILLFDSPRKLYLIGCESSKRRK